MTDLEKLELARRALERIAKHETRCVMPWTHEIAADTYSADLDRLRGYARTTLHQIGEQL